MIPTCIGLPHAKRQTSLYRDIHDWLYSHEFQTYEPQLYGHRSQNLAYYWNDDQKQMSWNHLAISKFIVGSHPQAFSYGRYWYDTNPQVLRWIVQGVSKNQDQLTLQGMTDLLWEQKQWFNTIGAPNAWIMVDEPPHSEKYGWTQEIENRVVKFVTAARNAEWTVGQCAPGPSQLRFWKDEVGIPVDRWILRYLPENENHQKWDPNFDRGEEVWMYNPPTLDGFSEVMCKFNATGYLQWSGVRSVGGDDSKEMIKVDEVEGTFVIQDWTYQLIEELKKSENCVPVIEPPEPSPSDIEKRISDIESILEYHNLRLPSITEELDESIDVNFESTTQDFYIKNQPWNQPNEIQRKKS